MSEVVNSSAEMDNQITLKKVTLNIFVIYFIISGIFIGLYGRDIYNYSFINGIMIYSFFSYFLMPFAVVLTEKVRFHYSKRLLLQSFVISFILTLVAWFQIFDYNNVANYGDEYFYSTRYGAYGAWYAFIGLSLLIYFSRNKIKNFFRFFYLKTSSAGKYSFKMVKKHGFKATLIPFVLEWWTVRKLQNNYRAVYFAKKFIIIQAKPIKASLPGLVPATVSTSVKDIFQNDIDRMHQLFKYNHITTYSKPATLKFVMRVADPIIKDLQLTLEQHLTEELLKESNSAKNMSIDVDTLWKKIEKIMTNWQSTFTESEFEYKDNLLVK